MSDIEAYRDDRRRALAARDGRIRRGEAAPGPLTARATLEGRSGARRISIRRHAVVTDSLPDFAGLDLGPGSPELQFGVLGCCLAHAVLIQAALLDLPITSLPVEVTGTFDPRAGAGGYADIPVHPQDLAYTVHVGSDADPAALRALEARVEAACPILNLLRLPQAVAGRFPQGEAPAPTPEEMSA